MEFEGGSEMAFREGEMFRCCCCLLVALNAAHTSLKNTPRRGEREGRILLFYYVEKGKSTPGGIKETLEKQIQMFSAKHGRSVCRVGAAALQILKCGCSVAIG
jgi:hypothetical protein